MAQKRAQITEQTAGALYGDALDRLLDRQTTQPTKGQTSRHPDGPPAKQQDGPAADARIKATFHLTRDDILIIDQLQMTAFSQTGKKPERSHLVSQALQLLAKDRTA